MERQITLMADFQCLNKQTYGYLLAFKKLRYPTDMTAEFIDYHTKIDVCSVHQLDDGDYIQCIMYGGKGLPFAILIPYSQEQWDFLSENKHKKFDLIQRFPPKPFGKDMYRAKDN